MPRSPDIASQSWRLGVPRTHDVVPWSLPFGVPRPHDVVPWSLPLGVLDHTMWYPGLCLLVSQTTRCGTLVFASWCPRPHDTVPWSLPLGVPDHTMWYPGLCLLVSQTTRCGTWSLPLGVLDHTMWYPGLCLLVSQTTRCGTWSLPLGVLDRAIWYPGVGDSVCPRHRIRIIDLGVPGPRELCDDMVPASRRSQTTGRISVNSAVRYRKGQVPGVSFIVLKKAPEELLGN